MKKSYTIARTALFSAFIAIFSQISIPSPTGIPFTLQTFAVALCGFCLRNHKGEACASIAVYIALGAVGIPVFSGFQGGFPRIVGPTGGFMLGFFPLVLLCGTSFENKTLRLIAGETGLVLCHLCGIAYYSFLMNLDLRQSFAAVSAPFLVKDFASVAAAVFVSTKIEKHISVKMS